MCGGISSRVRDLVMHNLINKPIRIMQHKGHSSFNLTISVIVTPSHIISNPRSQLSPQQLKERLNRTFSISRRLLLETHRHVSRTINLEEVLHPITPIKTPQIKQQMISMPMSSLPMPPNTPISKKKKPR